jgi:hypothetical protein
MVCFETLCYARDRQTQAYQPLTPWDACLQVEFDNTTFVGCQQASAGAVFGNNTVVAINNSNFTSNIGFQAGVVQLLGARSWLYVNNSLFYNNTGDMLMYLWHLSLGIHASIKELIAPYLLFRIACTGNNYVVQLYVTVLLLCCTRHIIQQHCCWAPLMSLGRRCSLRQA